VLVAMLLLGNKTCTMRKIYYLKTCDTCKRILKQMQTAVSEDIYRNFIFQEIKTERVTVAQLEEMYSLSNSYENLFSRRAKKYSQMNLKNETISEIDYKQLLLEEYTFLKRPVILMEDKIFIGNSKKNVDVLLNHLKTYK